MLLFISDTDYLEALLVWSLALFVDVSIGLDLPY